MLFEISYGFITFLIEKIKKAGVLLNAKPIRTGHLKDFIYYRMLRRHFSTDTEIVYVAGTFLMVT